MRLLQILHGQPVLAVFFVIGIGYLAGRLRAGGVQLGATTGVLLAGLLLGHLGLRGSGASQSVGFMLFIYCVGLQAGPQFFSAFRESGFKFAVLALAMGAVGVACSVAFTLHLGLPPGYGAGLLAGALTSTPTLVAAQDAVRAGMAALPPDAAPSAVLGNIAASYAISYVVGLFGLLLLVALVPRLMGVDLAAEARRVSAERDTAGGLGAPTAWGALPDLRAYRVTQEIPPAALARTGALLQSLKRDGAITDATAATALRAGDVVALLGPRPALRAAAAVVGPEVVDEDLLETSPERRTVLVTGARLADAGPMTIGDVLASGCAVLQVTRGGLDLAPTANLSLAKGDLVVVTGLPTRLDALARQLGRSQLAAHETDLVTFAFGIAAGILLGMTTVRVAGIPIGLGTAGGLLLTGLLVGYARTLNPTFGQLPVAAAGVLRELGLQFFIANIGLEAGSSIVQVMQTAGVALPLAAGVVMVVPFVVGLALGHLVLGFDAVILLGAITGAMTSTPALDVVSRQAESPLPTVGYAGTYAFANVLLAIAGSLLMRV